MIKISRKEVKHVAGLARLGLTEKEVKKFQAQLSSILEYMDILNEVNTKGVEPTAQTTGLENITRPDSPSEENCLPTERVLSLAPEKKTGYFKVKKIL